MVHISEEAKNASTAIPYCICFATLSAIVLGWGMYPRSISLPHYPLKLILESCECHFGFLHGDRLGKRCQQSYWSTHGYGWVSASEHPFQFVVDDITDLIQLVWNKRDVGHLGLYYRSTVRFSKNATTIFLHWPMQIRNGLKPCEYSLLVYRVCIPSSLALRSSQQRPGKCSLFPGTEGLSSQPGCTTSTAEYMRLFDVYGSH